MVTFNIRETGNELLRILEKELRSPRDCSLTIDMLIPEVLKGDKDGLRTSILLICQCLNPKQLNFSVNIELSKATYSNESFYLKIDIKGISNTRETIQQFLRIHQLDVNMLLGQLPYPTTFSSNGRYVCFSFTMLFFDAQDNNILPTKNWNKKILLAEDDDMTALVFISFMEEWGYNVTRVSDGDAAVEAAKQHVYDMIFVDTFLPKISGADAIRKIREWNKKITIVAVVTSPNHNDFADRHAGADDILFKPVSSTDLQKTLRKYL